MVSIDSLGQNSPLSNLPSSCSLVCGSKFTTIWKCTFTNPRHLPSFDPNLIPSYQTSSSLWTLIYTIYPHLVTHSFDTPLRIFALVTLFQSLFLPNSFQLLHLSLLLFRILLAVTLLHSSPLSIFSSVTSM